MGRNRGRDLRACGFEWDFRKSSPYSGYEMFDFEIPTAQNGDCFDRSMVRVEEMRQSLRIVEQCLNNMPEGNYKADHPRLRLRPLRNTRCRILTRWSHTFWMWAGDLWFRRVKRWVALRLLKGANSYYLISDGNTAAYRASDPCPVVSSYANGAVHQQRIYCRWFVGNIG